MSRTITGWKLNWFLEDPDGLDHPKHIVDGDRALVRVVEATHQEVCMMRLAKEMVLLLKRWRDEQVSHEEMSVIVDGIVGVCLEGRLSAIVVPDLEEKA